MLNAKREQVWAVDISDKPGGLAGKLEAMADAGVNLQFIVARRRAEKPGTGVVFVTPIEGDKPVAAARKAGFSPADGLHSVQVEGANEGGLAFKLSRQLSSAGINVRGISGGVIGDRCVIHLAFDSEADATRAVDLIRNL
jgi:hypothetical protein